MVVVACPECGGKISAYARICPHCHEKVETVGKLMGNNMLSSSGKACSIIISLLLCVLLGFCLAGCYSFSSQKQASTKAPPTSQSTTKSAPSKKTYSDIPTAYPNLYKYDSESALHNVYNESKVVSWDQASNYVGKEVTVEGDVNSVVYASNTKGSPFFYNVGGGSYDGFAVVIWSQDLSKFDDNTLRNDVNWSISDQPLNIRLRVSGVVEMYNGRPQITARDGSQVAEWVNGKWFSMISSSSIDSLMASLYH